MKGTALRWALVAAGPALLVVAAGSGPTANAQSSASVSINNFAFTPQTASVSTGGTVMWQNNQMGVQHTVTADDGSFDSGLLSTGQTFSMTFTQAGTIAYHCNVHPSMHGTIQVTAAMVAATQPQANASATPSAAASPVSAASPVASAASNASPAVGMTRKFPAGFALISAPPGSTVNAAALEDYNPVTNMYSTLANGQQPQAGHGYWAEFDAAGTVTLAAGSNQPVTITDPNGCWLLIGDPSGTLPALITGASAVFTFDPVQNKYNATMLLAPGDGAWAMAPAGSTITIAPGQTAPAPTPTPSPSPSPAVAVTPAPTQQPQPVITPAPTTTPQPNPYPYGYSMPMSR